MDVRTLRLRAAGMFSNVNEVVEQAARAERGGYRFVIDWWRSCYRDPERTGDPWAYYFEPCFADCADVNPEGLPVLPGGREVCCTRDNVITPRLRDGDCDPLLLPRDRERAGRILAARIRIRCEIRDEIETFRRERFGGRMIGLHIRGPGRTDGGANVLRMPYRKRFGVPLDRYYRFVDRLLARYPTARVFVTSDSSRVIADVEARYGRRAVIYPALRSPEGEMHAEVGRDPGAPWSPYRLGRDVLVEAELHAACDVFVHGNSNVDNYVLCRSPSLPNYYVYKGLGVMLSRLPFRFRAARASSRRAAA